MNFSSFFAVIQQTASPYPREQIKWSVIKYYSYLKKASPESQGQNLLENILAWVYIFAVKLP